MQNLLLAKPDPDRVAYISFTTQVVPATAQVLIATVATRVAQGFGHIYLMLSTPGGAVMSGLTIYNQLRAFPVKLTTHNVGNVDSIGNAIFLAGEDRFACQHSTFMFHGVGFDVAAGTRLEEKMLRERLDGIAADQRRIGSILTERTSLNDAEVAQLFVEAQTKDANFALAKGIIGGIADVDLPQGASVDALVFGG